MQNHHRKARSTSKNIKRSDFVNSINTILNSQSKKGKKSVQDRSPSSSSSSSSNSAPKIPKNLTPRSRIKYFNRKISSKLDPELKEYVRDFRKKVERKFNASKINSTYKFPRESKYLKEDAEERELENVTYYDLRW